LGIIFNKTKECVIEVNDLFDKIKRDKYEQKIEILE
jgi:hypothetical protein